MEPKGVHPLAIRALHEVGIDTLGLSSKSTAEFLGKAPVRYAIIVCDKAQQSCPRIQPFALRTLFWPFPDPAAAEGTEEERFEVFRDVRNQIGAEIRSWMAEFSVARPGADTR